MKIYLGTVHRVGLPKEYPTKRGNIWFHVSTEVETDYNTITNVKYTINEECSNTHKTFDNYHEALTYYDSITQIRS